MSRIVSPAWRSDAVTIQTCSGGAVAADRRPRGWEMGSIRQAFALALSLACLASAVEAQSAELRLAQAVRSALQGFPTVEAARAGSEEARAALTEAGAARFPAVRLVGSGTRYEEPMLVSPIHGFAPSLLPPFDETVYQTTLSLAYPIFDGGGRGARIRAARGRTEAADAELGATQQVLMTQVIRAYLETLGFRQVVEAHELRLEALRAERDRVSLMRTAGRAAPVDSLRVEAALANAEADRVRAASQLDVAERSLARLAGLSFDQVHGVPLEPVGSSGSAEVLRDTLLERAHTLSPIVRGAAAQKSAAGALLDAARSQLWPEMRLAGGYSGWMHPGGSPTWEWNTSLQLTWSVFDGGAIRGSIAGARAASHGADERLRLAALGLDQDVDRAMAELHESQSRARSLSAAVDRLAEVARIEKLLLESGAGTQTNFLTAEADLLAARAGLIEARHASIAAGAELARLTGELGYNWITQAMETQP